MTDKELMQQTLYTLEHFYENGYDREDCFAAITNLLQRLAQPEFDSALQSAAMTQTAPKLAQPEQEPKHDYRTRYDRGCYKCGSHYCPADCPEPEHSPLDRMAENARELGLDYEPVQEPVAGQPLPCPFCGASDGLTMTDGSTYRWGYAYCSNCGASAGETRRAYPDDGKWYQEAIQQWNQRTTPPRLEPLDIREICASICDRVAVYERQATNFSEDSLPWASFCADLIRGKKVDA